MNTLDFDSLSPEDLRKALGPGERWISVHPGGPGSKGVPVLIQEHPDGSARIIGGAGGKLNHMRLRGIKPASDYKTALAEKQKARQEARKEQVARDKELGIHDAKQEQRGKLREAMLSQRKTFIESVADLAGWDKKGIEFDEGKHAGLSEEAKAKARKEHEKGLLKRAKETVEANRKALVEDSEARAQSGLGELPLTTENPDQISVSDLDPMPERKPGLGFSSNYGQRAAENGLTPESAKAEMAEVHGAEGKQPEATKQSEKKALADKTAEELDKFKLENPDTFTPSPKVLSDAKKAAALVVAMKKLKMAEQQAKTASLAIDNATLVESKAHIIEVSDADVEEAARKQMEDDVRTVDARAFLTEVGKMGGSESLGGHVATGSFNALNAFAQAVGGDSLIDRSVVDVLGVSVAAQVLARRIGKDYEAGELDRIKRGVEDYHVHAQSEKSRAALKTAQELHDAAASIELPDGATGFDLAHAQELNAKRRDAVVEAKKVLGQALGELEANAHLVSALNAGPAKSTEVNLGKLAPEAAITQLHAIGLKTGDYKLDKVGDALVASINGDGLDRLARPIDREGMARIKRNMDIIEGRQDEDGWLPEGFANRPDLAMKVEPGVAERLAQPFSPGVDLAQSMRDYIGGRAADGDAPADILADLQSADFVQKAGSDANAFRKALDSVAPLKDENGKMRPIESLDGKFRIYADDFAQSRFGGKRQPIHRQEFAVDQRTVDVLHRALSENPDGVAAFKPIGDLSPQERNGLRKWFMANVAKEDPAAKEKRDALEAHEKNEPEKESVDMFGETSVNPDWHGWKSKRDDLAQAANSAGLDWNKYVDVMGGPVKAIESIQDLVRSRVLQSFALSHNSLHPDNPLKIGKTVIRGNLNHLDAVDPAAREKRLADQKALVDSLRERSGGKYASGSVQGKIESAKETKAAFDQAQMGFFSTEELQPNAAADLKADERYTLGHAAEQKVAGLMSVVGQNFKPGQPTRLFHASMDGKFVAQQRAVKHIVANKRTALAYGAGSGKTAIYLGAFAHLHQTGQIKRAVMLVPSIVQGQFHGEALRYLEPGKFNWHCEPGASREERIAAYKDPSKHFCVMTHESFRSDMVHLGAKHAGMSEGEMVSSLGKMQPAERKAWAKSVMEKEGIDFGATFVDEAHQLVNRAGKENSARSNVIDAVSDNTPFFCYGSGDPIKNDCSELQDVMSKMDRERYGNRDEFMRKYGGDTIGAKQALKREMARHVISNLIAPDVQADRNLHEVDLSAGQKAALKKLDAAMAKAKAARTSGTVDLAAAKEISPEAFDGVPEEKHEEVAKAIQSSLGIIKQSATQRIINTHPDNAKIDKIMDLVKERNGKQGVVFAKNRAAVAEIEKRLKAAGHRVVTITGSDSGAEKDKKKLMFNPESGDRQADILVASDAAAVGMNLQSGQYLIQHDCPDTAMIHGQRNARIHRLGQKQNVELLDVAARHPSEKKARERLAKKYALREFMLDPMEGLDDSGIASYLKGAPHAQKDQGFAF